MKTGATKTLFIFWLALLLAFSLAAYDEPADDDQEADQPGPPKPEIEETDLPAEPEKPEPVPAVFANEYFHYKVGWNNLEAADAYIRVKEVQYSGRRCYHIKTEIKSRPVIDWLWKVRDQLDVYIEIDTFRPLRYTFRQREGRYNHDTDIIFDYQNNKATSLRTYKDRVRKMVIPADQVVDPITAIFMMRKAKVDVGDKRYLTVFDGKRVHTIHYEIVRQQSLETTRGMVIAYKVLPKILKTEPPIKKRGDSDKVAKVHELFLWMGSDAPAPIYRVESDVTVGSVFAELEGG